MRNVLSIIGENAGLLEDQLALAGRREKPDPDKLKRVAERVARQVNNAVEAMERFSRFAHAADQQRASIDAAALVENATVLARRGVTRDGYSLETELPNEPVPMTTNPFSFQHAVFSCLELVRECAEKGRPIAVKMTSDGASVVLAFSGAAPSDGDTLASRLPKLSRVIGELDGDARTSCDDGVLSLVLTLPARNTQTTQ
jgi:nitrogen fixation/metabolism regulation signal transduction histidine kinase